MLFSHKFSFPSCWYYYCNSKDWKVSKVMTLISNFMYSHWLVFVILMSYGGYWISFLEIKSWGVMLTTQRHLVLSRAITLFSLWANMSCSRWSSLMSVVESSYLIFYYIPLYLTDMEQVSNIMQCIKHSSYHTVNEN